MKVTWNWLADWVDLAGSPEELAQLLATRGLPVESLKGNLQKLIDKAKAKNPTLKVVIAGMQIPPNLGPEYAADFARVFAELARENNAVLIPFLLQGVGGERELNQSDMIHPTAAGHRIIADLVWRTLEPILRKG